MLEKNADEIAKVSVECADRQASAGTDDEMIIIVASRILEEHKAAFMELAR